MSCSGHITDVLKVPSTLNAAAGDLFDSDSKAFAQLIVIYT